MEGQLFLAVGLVPVCITGHLGDLWHISGMHPLPPGWIFLLAGHSLGMVLGGNYLVLGQIDYLLEGQLASLQPPV